MVKQDFNLTHPNQIFKVILPNTFFWLRNSAKVTLLVIDMKSLYKQITKFLVNNWF